MILASNTTNKTCSLRPCKFNPFNTQDFSLAFSNLKIHANVSAHNMLIQSALLCLLIVIPKRQCLIKWHVIHQSQTGNKSIVSLGMKLEEVCKAPWHLLKNPSANESCHSRRILMKWCNSSFWWHYWLSLRRHLAGWMSHCCPHTWNPHILILKQIVLDLLVISRSIDIAS